MIEKKNMTPPKDNALDYFVSSLSLVNDTSEIHVSRDKDDDKFLECAFNCGALYVISGDNDLLDIKEYGDIKIITANEFLELVK